MLSCKRMQNVKNFLLLLLLLCTGQRLAYAVDRWNTTPSHAHLTSNKCTITRLPRSELTTQLFRTHFLETAPVVVTGLGRYSFQKFHVRDAAVTQLNRCWMCRATAAMANSAPGPMEQEQRPMSCSID